jgi:hypothetical protein
LRGQECASSTAFVITQRTDIPQHPQPPPGAILAVRLSRRVQEFPNMWYPRVNAKHRSRCLGRLSTQASRRRVLVHRETDTLAAECPPALETAISISDQYWDAAFSFTITSLGTVPGMTGGICAKKLTCLWRSVTLFNGGWAFCSSQPQDVTRRTSDETISRFDPALC